MPANTRPKSSPSTRTNNLLGIWPAQWSLSNAFHLGLRGTRSNSTIHGAGEARGFLEGSLLAVVLIDGGTGRTADSLLLRFAWQALHGGQRFPRPADFPEAQSPNCRPSTKLLGLRTQKHLSVVITMNSSGRTVLARGIGALGVGRSEDS